MSQIKSILYDSLTFVTLIVLSDVAKISMVTKHIFIDSYLNAL